MKDNHNLVSRLPKFLHANRSLHNLIMFGFISVDSKSTCLLCGAILTNNSMKKAKLERLQKSRHLSSVGKDREYFENKKKRQPVKLSDFIQKMNTAMAKTLNPSYLFY